MKKATKIMIVSIIGLLVGISIRLYPFVIQQIDKSSYTTITQQYITKGAKFSQKEQETEFNKIKEFNKKITNQHETENALKMYDDVLDFYDGVMGVVKIPSLDLELPIYHTVDEESISNGAGHYEYSPIPIGEDNTNSLITSHSGLPNKELFTNLEKMKIGDKFTITVMNLTTEYTVDKIDVIKPEELKTVALTNDDCYVSLFTCTPISVNSHRLVVRGVKTDSQLNVQKTELNQETINSFNCSISTATTTLVIIIAIITVMAVIIVIIKNTKTTLNKSKEGEGAENPDENENG